MPKVDVPARFKNDDGTLNFKAIIAASDRELRAIIAPLSSIDRQAYRRQARDFELSFMQKAAAKLAGINIEDQRSRLMKLLDE